MLKKLIFPLLIVSSMLSANGYLVGKVTKQQAQDFVAGLCVGVIHGIANNLWRGEDSSLTPLATFIAAHKLEATYNGNKGNLVTLWGHGIGQFLTEAIKVKYDKVSRSLVVGFDRFRMNLTLFLALLS